MEAVRSDLGVTEKGRGSGDGSFALDQALY